MSFFFSSKYKVTKIAVKYVIKAKEIHKRHLFERYNLNWDFILHLEGREPNVSYPNS